MKKNISLHPKLVAVLDGIFSVVLLFWMSKISSIWFLAAWFLLRAAWWIALSLVMYYPSATNRWHHSVALIIFNLGCLFLFLFVDTPLAWRAVAGAFFIFPLISFWFVPSRDDQLPALAKPFRRWKFLTSAFGIAGIWCGVFALSIFQVIGGYFLAALVLAGVMLATLISAWWWYEYSIKLNKQFFLASITLFILILEIALVMLFWPLGYLVSSLLITWIWYILWLLLRFSLSVEGVDWKRQRVFLILNGLLMVAFLVFWARWK